MPAGVLPRRGFGLQPKRLNSSSSRLAPPPGEVDPSALTRAGLDVKIVRKSTGAAEAKSQAAAGREAVPQRPLNVRNSRALIFEDQFQTTAVLVVQRLDLHGAAAAVQNGITGQLARRRHDFGLVYQAETHINGPLADKLPRQNDILGRFEAEHFMSQDGHCPAFSV